MEITFETKSVEAFYEGFHQIKRTQLSMESVVPDVCDDIGRLLCIQPCIFLKSKDLTAYGATVGGELTAALLYINEAGERIFDLHLSQSFSLDFEMAEPDPELLTQVRLFVVNTESRALNPRKVAVTVELGGELFAYRQAETRIAVLPPPLEDVRVYSKTEKTKQLLINAVTEKTFVLNEQFAFPSGKAAPERLASTRAEFRVADCQFVGSKALIKGMLKISCCYLSDEGGRPVTADFSAPFSQLVDLGQEELDAASVHIEANSAYYSLIDLMSGEKALDAEIHAVAQLVCRAEQSVETVSDAYCNRMPSELHFETLRFAGDAGERILPLSADERLELPEDCADLLNVFPSLSQSRLEQGRAELNVVLDVLYKNKSGALLAFRRLLALSGDCPSESAQLCRVRLTDCSFRPEGGTLAVRIGAEMLYAERSETAIPCVSSILLDEDAVCDSAKLPAYTAVRVDHESVWDLAKSYHSSCEAIEANNELEGPLQGKMLLIPKCM